MAKQRWIRIHETDDWLEYLYVLILFGNIKVETEKDIN